MIKWFQKLRFKLHKQKALFEVRSDIAFLKKYRVTQLGYNEVEARKQYVAEKQKPDDEQDQKLLGRLSREIAEYQAVKKEVADLVQLEKDLVDYIAML